MVIGAVAVFFLFSFLVESFIINVYDSIDHNLFDLLITNDTSWLLLVSEGTVVRHDKLIKIDIWEEFILMVFTDQLDCV